MDKEKSFEPIDFESEREKRERKKVFEHISKQLRNRGFVINRTFNGGGIKQEDIHIILRNGETLYSVWNGVTWNGDTLDVYAFLVEEVKPPPFRTFMLESTTTFGNREMTAFETVLSRESEEALDMPHAGKLQFMDELMGAYFDKDASQAEFETQMGIVDRQKIDHPGIKFEVGWINAPD